MKMLLLAAALSVSGIAYSADPSIGGTRVARYTEVTPKADTNSPTLFNSTHRATGAATIAQTIQPFIGGVGDWWRINNTNASILHRIDSNGVVRLGSDVYINNGLDVSGASVFNEGTFNAAVNINSILDVAGIAAFASDVTMNGGLQVVGLLNGSDASMSGLVNFNGAVNFNGETVLFTSATPTTDSAAEVAFDSNAWAADRGAVQVFDGTASTFLLGVLASDTPSNGQFPRWNTGGTITWETVSGSGSFYGDTAITNLVVTNSPSQNTLITLANDSGSASLIQYGMHAGLYSFSSIMTSNRWRLVPDFGTSGPDFISMQRDNRSLTFGSSAGSTSLNNISNNANVYNASNVIVGGSLIADSFEAYGDGSEVGKSEFFATNGNDRVAIGANVNSAGTNFFRIDVPISGMTAGQVLQVHSKTTFGTTNIMVLTNATPSSGSFSYDVDAINGFTNTTLTTLSTNALPTNVTAFVEVRAVAGGATNTASYHQTYTFRRTTTGTVEFKGSNVLSSFESLPILDFYIRTNGNNIESVYQGQTNEPMKWRVQGTILLVTNDGPHVASGGSDYTTGLIAWYRAQSESYADNDPVGTMTDQSGSGNNATAAGGARPTFKTGIVNSKAVYRFDGSSDAAQASAFSLGGGAGVTVIAVVKSTAAAADEIIVEASSNAALQTDAFYLFNESAADKLQGNATGNSGAANFETTAALGTSDYHVIVVVFNKALAGGETTIYVDGQSAGSRVPNFDNSGTFGTHALNIGARNGGAGSLWFTGDIAEIRVYPEALSTPNQQAAEDALGTYYGISITH